MSRVIDLFAGPGGWDVGAAELGIPVPVGFEHDAAACATRAAAGHRTVRADVALWPLEHMLEVDGLIASPPCQDWSVAGKGAGVESDRGRLVFEVLRWGLTLKPRWIACEQVPPVEPLYRQFAMRLEGSGYRTWVGVLNAADYGVPQTRRRVFLLASLDRQPLPPEPTHERRSGMFPLLPWVSMATALGWGLDDRPCFTVSAGGTETGGTEPLSRHARTVLHTNRDQREDGTRQTRDTSAPSPSPSLTAKAGGQCAWERPATCVMGDPRIFRPDHHGDSSPPQHVDAIKITLRDALILQSFDPDYPVQGAKTKQFEQIGNAVPPVLARRVLEAVA